MPTGVRFCGGGGSGGGKLETHATANQVGCNCSLLTTPRVTSICFSFFFFPSVFSSFFTEIALTKMSNGLPEA